ncbi:MAG TPA: S53 family peptidase [Ktedonobacteraceae bacterium]|nr:S53 family peptidase [Ktedonobacteraceae bacterium]
MNKEGDSRLSRIKFLRRPVPAIFTLGLVVLLLISALGVWATNSHAAGSPPPVSIPGSIPPVVAQAQLVGHYNSASTGANNMPMLIGVVLAPNHENQIQALVQGMYNRHSPQYHHWLQTGEYDKLFGPTANQMTAVEGFLKQAGLSILPQSVSATIVMAAGSSAQIEAAFHVTINTYRASDGTTFFANSNDIQIPGSLSGQIIDVFGLDNISSQVPLYTSQEGLHVSGPPTHPNYGGGPFGSGLTPSQIASLYDAQPLYSANDQGKGRVLGLAEFSGYTPGDIRAYEKQFHLPNVAVQNILLPKAAGKLNHKGAVEVELDIDMQIALAPKVNKILVYEAPNLGSNIIPLYQKIATDNKADAVSTSWGNCEAVLTLPFVQAENNIFTQMAMQSQSMFAAAGDAGARDCLHSGSTNNSLQVDDPAAQPFVTAVGGTSFGSFDPGGNATPAYPQGSEIAWTNGGGGVSHFWSQPAYQVGPGVNEPSYSQNGSWCGQSAGVSCREVPDVSINADSNTGYAIYCADPTPCPSGHILPLLAWQQVGGTSAGAPLWAAIAVLADNYNHQRLGFLNPLLYSFDGASNYSSVFHDIQSGNNGNYPTGPYYDMVTGMGTPDIYNLVTETPLVFGPGGNIWVTGHDIDYHCSVEFNSCHYLQVALTYVMNGSTLPVLALDHGTEVATAISNAFPSNTPTVDTVDPRTGFASLPLIGSDGSPLYSAIVVASDTTCGGCDNNDSYGATPDSDAINVRAADIAQFMDAGGGILALAGAENIGVFYNFLPVPVTATTVTSPFTFTSFGLSLGLVEGQDDNCCPTHNSFNLPVSGGVYQVAETDAAGLAETLVAQNVLVAPALRHMVAPKRSGSPPRVPHNQ